MKHLDKVEQPNHKEKPESEYNNKLIFDMDSLMERIIDDKELAIELLNIFIEEIPQMIDDIQGAIEKGDMKVVKEIAHKMKGSAGNLSAEEIRKVALNFEKVSNYDEYVILLQEIKKEFIQFQSVVQPYLI